MADLFQKKSWEDEYFNINFADREQIVAGKTISSATLSFTTPSGATDLTIGGTPGGAGVAQPAPCAVSGNVVQIRIAGGTVGQTYALHFALTLNDGEIIGWCPGMYIETC